jgi:hypothetical protein
MYSRKCTHFHPGPSIPSTLSPAPCRSRTVYIILISQQSSEIGGIFPLTLIIYVIHQSDSVKLAQKFVTVRKVTNLPSLHIWNRELEWISRSRLLGSPEHRTLQSMDTKANQSEKERFTVLRPTSRISRRLLIRLRGGDGGLSSTIASTLFVLRLRFLSIGGERLLSSILTARVLKRETSSFSGDMIRRRTTEIMLSPSRNLG